MSIYKQQKEQEVIWNKTQQHTICREVTFQFTPLHRYGQWTTLKVELLIWRLVWKKARVSQPDNRYSAQAGFVRIPHSIRGTCVQCNSVIGWSPRKSNSQGQKQKFNNLWYLIEEITICAERGIKAWRWWGEKYCLKLQKCNVSSISYFWMLQILDLAGL